MGSLFTSIIPNLICKEIIDAIDKSKADIMYICNIMTQPGETEDFTVSDHVKMLNSYLGKRKINVVLANSGKIDMNLAKKYETLEQKDPVIFDEDNLKDIKVISDDFIMVANNMIRHNNLKLGFHVYSYLMQ